MDARTALSEADMDAACDLEDFSKFLQDETCVCIDMDAAYGLEDFSKFLQEEAYYIDNAAMMAVSHRVQC
ncbi:hypothetical protein CBR_g17879 [Chara braunii]|uniref:Uncharacterized protein n=1 Tax=Chara braunii TaxID=69332 RepID=A0A388KVT0_CHABU|nr:hypothetical protein CBR_g17879 [Chara braunii]|eukprot:GBG74166.1 hypothetical protein CBR_g17879 [Chara braunii]